MGCAELPGGEVGDCMTAAMEARGEEGSCDVVTDPVWRDECLFLEGERLRKQGKVEEAFRACEQTRFGRECSYHIVRDEARAVVNEPIEAAEEHFNSLPWGKRVPDSDSMFWESWFTHRRYLEMPVDRRSCDALKRRTPCQEGADRTFDEAALGAQRKPLCAALEAGEPPILLDDGSPAFWLDSYSVDRAKVLCR